MLICIPFFFLSDRMFIPVDDGGIERSQYIWTIDKDEKGEVTKKKLFGVRYVPLTDAPK
jgi:protein-L-isoaspartate(D-aspartate) O-methyltransferase